MTMGKCADVISARIADLNQLSIAFPRIQFILVLDKKAVGQIPSSSLMLCVWILSQRQHVFVATAR